jgi:hypothetical protein
MRRRLVEPLVRLGSLVVALVLAHDLAFLASKQGAYAAALAASGHDAGWVTTVLVVAGLSGLLLAVGLARLAFLGLRLRAAARSLAPGGSGSRGRSALEASADGRPRDRLRGLAHSSARLAGAVTVGFVIQENVEHLSAGLPAPGFAILAWDGNFTPLPIIGLTSLAVAAVVGLFRRRQADLLARVRAAGERAFPHTTAGRPRTPGRASDADGRGSLLGRRMALRAPPTGASA